MIWIPLPVKKISIRQRYDDACCVPAHKFSHLSELEVQLFVIFSQFILFYAVIKFAYTTFGQYIGMIKYIEPMFSILDKSIKFYGLVETLAFTEIFTLCIQGNPYHSSLLPRNIINCMRIHKIVSDNI